MMAAADGMIVADGMMYRRAPRVRASTSTWQQNGGRRTVCVCGWRRRRRSIMRAPHHAATGADDGAANAACAARAACWQMCVFFDRAASRSAIWPNFLHRRFVHFFCFIVVVAVRKLANALGLLALLYG